MSRSFVRRRAANRSLLPRPSAVARVALMTGSCNSDRVHPARDHLVLALDVDSLDDALALVRRLRPWFGVAKVGLQLFSAAGPDAIAAVRDEGLDVFADLKLHDIPTTVGRAATVVGRTGARYLTTHAAGGVVMVRAAVDGFEHGAAMAGHPSPTTLAVTVLTSDPDSGPDVLAQRVAVAVAAGAPGLVCSAPRRRAGPLGLRGRDHPLPGDPPGRVAGRRPGEGGRSGRGGRGGRRPPRARPRRHPRGRSGGHRSRGRRRGRGGARPARSQVNPPLGGGDAGGRWESRARVTSWLRPRPSAPNSAKPR